MRLVLDTNIVVAAMRSPRGASAELLRREIAGQVTIIGTVALALEYEDVCCRPNQIAAAGLTIDGARQFVDEVIARLEPVERAYRWRPQLSDEKDELVFEAAVNGRADALVTFNTRDFEAAAPLFGLRLTTPFAILEQLA